MKVILQTLTLIFTLPIGLWGQMETEPGEEAIQQHHRAVHLLPDTWMRDPYIYRGPAGTYYLTYTTGKDNIPLWQSSNLVDWTQLPDPYRLSDASNYAAYQASLAARQRANPDFKGHLKVWAPELYFLDGRWIYIHTSNVRSGNLAWVEGEDPILPKQDWGNSFGHQHDPSIFTDEDGSHWLVAKCASIQRIKADWSGFEGEPIKLGPSDRKLGHEGCFILKYG
ncbi:MAG: family 43 glycosylhydrolase, partial [Bacteroidota bacterium]